MIVSGIEQMGETPFDTVLIHGLVRDEQGRKMSKSLGNGVDPLEIIDRYGADALRFSLAMGVSPGNDIRFSAEKVEGARNFANKVWNASRFVLMNTQTREDIDPTRLTLPDQWILSRFRKAAGDVSAHMDDNDFGMAAQKIYDFSWSEFCDWYIELSKDRLTGEDEPAKRNARAVLLHVLEGLLKLLHPFMPFLTEEVYQHLPGREGMLILAPWPQAGPGFDFEEQERQMEGLMEIIRAIRNLRAEMSVQPSRRAHVTLIPESGWEDTLALAEPYLRRLAGASDVKLEEKGFVSREKTVSAVCAAGEVRIPLGDLVDFAKEAARLQKEAANLESEISRAQGKLDNPGFIAKAPAALVEQEKEKLKTAQSMLAALRQRIAELKANL
jgi:valyl-tRNA synthetase